MPHRFFRNPDDRAQALRRAAREGDKAAARLLAIELLRSGLLSPQEIVTIGEPAREALMQEAPQLLAGLVRVLVPSIWIVSHAWSDRGMTVTSGPASMEIPFLTPMGARAEAFRRAVNILEDSDNEDALGYMEPGDYETMENLVQDWRDTGNLGSLDELLLILNNIDLPEGDQIAVTEREIKV
jgi:hypothetical protein